ncbi:lysophospholipid acyltransferase family protein [Croceibacterium salegens]|uniref:lysophospholipid acyltransferase family protein n=1 Tax=Croceibacterium salegens TaxID=1737568 RepID=UPI000AFF1AAF|nr:1-acyl-sn-glycerol-3-phosphate acyltransferase [Croceibacterium salegens]
MGNVRLYLRIGGVLLFALLVFPILVLAPLFRVRDYVAPFILGFVGRIVGLRVRVDGKPRPRALYLANHESWLDILALGGCSRTVFVAHSGLAGHPVLRWLCQQNETVFISRDVRSSVAQQVGQVREALGDRPLTIFPEGTTNDGEMILPFRSSLLAAVESLGHEVPVQPVALEYADAPNTCWYGDEPGMANIRRVLSRRGRIDLTAHFLDPLAGDALTNRKTMAGTAQQAIAERLKR